MVTIVMRLSEGRVRGKTGVLAVNYLSCMGIAGAYIGFGQLVPRSEGFGLTLGLGAISGVFYLLGLLLMQYNIRKNGIVLSSVFSRVGDLLVPLLIAVCFFGEVPTAVQIAGAIIAIFSIITINYDKSYQSEQLHSVATLFFLFLADGFAGAMSKIFGEVGNSAFTPHFLFFTFASAFILCLILMIRRKEKIGKKELLFGVLIGAPNFFASRFLLAALEQIPAVIAYPTRGVAGIVVVSLAGIFLFGEKLKKRQWIALGAILVAITLLNI